MTNEEAIITLMTSNEYHHALGDLPHSCKSIQAFELAIKALEQEPCEDCISRDIVHEMLENVPINPNDKWFNWLQKACLRLAELPSVQPKTEQEPNTNILDKIRAEIKSVIQKETVIDHSGGEYESVVLKLDPDDVLEIIDKYRAESEE